MANNRRKFNAIGNIKVNGQVFSDVVLMKNAIVHFYEDLFHDNHAQRPFLDGISYDTISSEDSIELVREFSEEEVRNAINNLGKEKASVPDGFNIAFFQHCWDTVKGNLMVFFSDFHARGVFHKSLNATFLCLIPKMVGLTILRSLGLLALWGVFTKSWLKSLLRG